jgi:hypothetical protein
LDRAGFKVSTFQGFKVKIEGAVVGSGRWFTGRNAWQLFVVMQTAVGSFDYVRLAPHFAQDDSGWRMRTDNLKALRVWILKLCNFETLQLCNFETWSDERI